MYLHILDKCAKTLVESYVKNSDPVYKKAHVVIQTQHKNVLSITNAAFFITFTCSSLLSHLLKMYQNTPDILGFPVLQFLFN
jgi:hypothetical protein